jgi:hypothetical protein
MRKSSAAFRRELVSFRLPLTRRSRTLADYLFRMSFVVTIEASLNQPAR